MLEPMYIVYAVAGGILLILLLGWIVERNLAKQVQQQPDPFMSDQ